MHSQFNPEAEILRVILKVTVPSKIKVMEQLATLKATAQLKTEVMALSGKSKVMGRLKTKAVLLWAT